VARLFLFRCGRIVCGFQVRRMPLNIAQVLAAAWFVGLVIAASLGWASRFRRGAGRVSLVIGSRSLWSNVPCYFTFALTTSSSAAAAGNTSCAEIINFRRPRRSDGPLRGLDR
jgi:hypothetical protein